jgi:DNA-binding NtrC family response regulator
VNEVGDCVLVVEDDPIQRKMICMLLSKLGYSVRTAENGKQALIELTESQKNSISIVLLDVSMPVMDGFEALKHIKVSHAEIPVIMLTAQNDTNVAVQAIKNGASDFIVKPPEPSHLDVAIQNAIKISLLTREVSRLRRDKKSTLLFSDIIGYQYGLKDVTALGRKAAASELPVLISGETGTGKELFASAIHGEGRRAGAPFLAINCGAIPENLVESALFGHEKGAFTGATVRTIGKFREAEGGTIFLDEIGELPLETQVKILRVLQQKEIEPVGAGHPVKINVRIISATNRDLKAEVKAGRFREDLYYRLNVLPIHMPPLRSRKQDTVLLAEYFVQKFSMADGPYLKKLSDDAKNYLMQCSWPGNVRELENLIHGTMVFFDGDTINRAHFNEIHVTEQLSDQAPLNSNPAGDQIITLLDAKGKIKTMDTLEMQIIKATLDHYQQNIAQAAEALGVAKSTFYRKLRSAE